MEQLGKTGYNPDCNRLVFYFENQRFETQNQFLSGVQIKKLVGLDQLTPLYLKISLPWKDELIENETVVNLARPEIEHFYSKDKDYGITLIMNGRQKPWTEKAITFEQGVFLAFGSYDQNPNKVYTVTYDRGPHENPEGSMVKGDKVLVKDKMIFNVTCTDKS